jgi:pilus assembly protein CpaE
MQQSMPRILFISGSDANWLWLSDAVGDRFMLVRESGTFSEITKRVGLVSPSMAVVDYSPQVGLDASLIVKELRELAPDLPVVAMGSKDST